MTEAFLEFSQSVGNDLSTPRPGFDFPGLKPGDQWCICLTRWLQAYHEGIAPKGCIGSYAMKKSLELIDLTELIQVCSQVKKIFFKVYLKPVP